jgi:hypothetical protein
MSEIRVEKSPTKERLDKLGVYRWPIWEKEESEFPWTYGEPETCYFLEGDVTVTPKGGKPTRVGKGDLVTFPSGMSCVWHVHQAVRKHYNFG